MKTLEQILELSKNQFYMLSESEIEVLNKYLDSLPPIKMHKNKNVISKHDSSVQKNNTDIN